MYRSILLVVSLVLFGDLFAQKGTITGTITAEEAGRIQPMPFVNVALKGAGVSANTDLDGKFTMTAEPGAYTLVVSFVGYEPSEREVTVTSGERTLADVELKGQGIEMKSLDVVTTKRTETETAVVLETRKSEQVVNGIGRQQIAKGQDRNAGDVVKRIPGVTLVGDRFLMIRGLAERYNTVMLNDVIAPSLEPDKRAFSFDLVPSGALDRILIYKTGAPELPGEFAGGVVKIHTLSVPQENVTRVNYSASFRSGTTGSSFLTDKAGNTDALGMDLGARALPSNFPAKLSGLSGDQLANAGRSLTHYWSPRTTTALPDQRFALLLARRFGKEGGPQFGNVTTVDYALTTVSYDAKNYNYNAYDPNTQRSDTIYRYSDSENIRTARISLLHNWTALIGSRTKLEFKNLLNQLGEERTTYRTGVDLEGGSEVRNYAFRWQERTIYSGQLHGDHDLANDRTNVQWTAGYGFALSKEPDYRRARTQRSLDATDSNQPFSIQIAPTASVIDAGRYFSELRENVVTGRVDVEQKVGSETGKMTGKLRAGLFTEMKDREFSARWMSFVKSNFTQFDQSLLKQPLEVAFSDANINNTTGFKLGEGTNPSDAYTAANTLMAGYLGSTFTFDSTITLSAGGRVEYNHQELTSGTYTNGEITVDNPVVSVLPSLNASYNLTKRALVRIAASQAVNRPEFRELAPFTFYDFSSNTTLTGNPDLKVARIMNVDARWEFYPSSSEVISLGGFYKKFQDPIEMYFVAVTGSGGARNFTYGNAPSASTVGAELELRRALSSLKGTGVISKLTAVANASLIKSTVDLGASAIQERTRPMVGQSPYVANAGLYFDDTDRKVQFSVLWNVFGKRLYAVGSQITPNIYEMPRNTLDLTASKGFGKHFVVKVSAQDLLNQRMYLKQDSNADGAIDAKDEDVLSYRRGQYFSVGLNYTL